MIVEAIVLKVSERGEYDRVITCYTRHLGKIDILVRSARKIPSKLVQFTSGLISLLDLTITPGKNYYHLIGGTVKKYFPCINADYQKSVQVKYIFKVVDEAIKPEKASAKIFDLLTKVLIEVNKSQQPQTEIFIYAFLIKFLTFLGHRPEIKNCLVCHRKLLSSEREKSKTKFLNFRASADNTGFKNPLLDKNEKIYFNLDKGGIICGQCLKKEKLMVIAPEALKILQSLLYQDFNFLSQKSFVNKDFQQAQKIIKQFLEWHLK